MDNQKPSVGRIVHLIDSLGNHYAAIITEVVIGKIGQVNLSFFVPNNGNLLCASGVEYDETATKPSTWHWPERV